MRGVVVLTPPLALEDFVRHNTYILVMHCGMDVMIFRCIPTVVVLILLVILVYLVGQVPLVLVK